MGLEGRRLGGRGKGIGGWWREWFGCYGPQNYKGLIWEWVEKEEGVGKKDV